MTLDRSIFEKQTKKHNHYFADVSDLDIREIPEAMAWTILSLRKQLKMAG